MDTVKKQINILFCIEYLAYGGTEKQLITLIEGLKGLNYRPHLCCLRRSAIGESRKDEAKALFDEVDCNKIQLDFISLRNIRWYKDLFALMRFIKNHKIDIVQTYFQDPTLFGLIAGRLCGVKHIVACFRDMGFWHKRKSDKVMRNVYRLCSNYLANSEAVRDEYIRLFKLKKNKFCVIYNGIKIDRQMAFANLKIKCKAEHIMVGIVANLNRQVKRVDIFLKAASYVAERRKQVRFVIIGDGELRGELISICNELGIQKVVEFAGKIRDVETYLKRIDIGVVSSDSEGFSNAVLEYMASGVPVVATSVGGNNEAIENGKSGFLVSAGDYKLMGQRILELASLKEKYLKIQRQALERVACEFSEGKTLKAYSNYYAGLMADERGKV